MSDPERQQRTHEQLEFAREIGRTASAQAASAVREMLGMDIHVSEISSGLLRLETLMEATDDLGNAAVGVYSRVEGDAPGHAVFLFPQWQAPALAAVLEGRESGEISWLDHQGHSSLLDLGQVIISSALTSFTNETGLEMRSTPALLVVDMAWAIVSSLIAFPFGHRKLAMVVATNLGYENLDGLFVFIPDPGSLDKMLNAHGKKAA